MAERQYPVTFPSQPRSLWPTVFKLSDFTRRNTSPLTLTQSRINQALRATVPEDVARRIKRLIPIYQLSSVESSSRNNSEEQFLVLKA